MNLPLDEVKKLYYQDGLSASEIAKSSGLTVWQVIKFMKKNGLPRRKSEESNHLRYLRQKSSFQVKSTLTIYEEQLKVAALMLYWAEGVKTGGIVDFPNSDPKMILLFLKFLRIICRIDEKKLRILLYCYANQNVNDLIEYWSKIALIPKQQLYKPYIRRDFKPDGRRMLSGLVHIRYNDKKLFLQFIEWIGQYKEF